MHFALTYHVSGLGQVFFSPGLGNLTFLSVLTKERWNTNQNFNNSKGSLQPHLQFTMQIWTDLAILASTDTSICDVELILTWKDKVEFMKHKSGQKLMNVF